MTGAFRTLGVEVAPVIDAKGRRLASAFVIRDISRETALMERLRDLAGTDPLTGVDNRRRFFELAEREIELARRSGSELSICICDLDHFKDVNDRFGHAAGDAVLREAAARFRSCLRNTDLLCRIGGEEFAILFPDCGEAVGMAAAGRMRERLSGTAIDFEGLAIRISASFGVASRVPGPDDDVEHWLRLADEALYDAKAGGRDQVRGRKARRG